MNSFDAELDALIEKYRCSGTAVRDIADDIEAALIALVYSSKREDNP